MALSLGASSSEDPVHCTGIFQTYKSSNARKSSWNERGLFADTQVTAQTTEACEERWEHPWGKYMTMFNSRDLFI